MAIMTPQEYENTRFQNRLQAVRHRVGELSKDDGYVPRPLLTLDQYLNETEKAAALRVPLEQVEGADLSFLTCSSEIKRIKWQMKRLFEKPQYKMHGFNDDELLAEACLATGLLVEGNFGTVILGKTEDGFNEIGDAMSNDAEFRQMYDIQNKGRAKLAYPRTEYTHRLFNPKKISGESRAEQAAEVRLMNYDIDPGNLVTLSIHGSSLGIAKVVLNTARLVKTLGLAVHFQEGVKPSDEWPGVFHGAGRTQ